jgi:predicted metal-dependent peptidase
MARMRRETAGAIKDHAQSKGRGTVPDSLVRWADEQLAPPKIDWRRKLAQTVRGAVAYKSGAVDLHWTKMSRRQAGIGFGPGRPIIPAYRAPVPLVACGVDTSGSMSQEDLTTAAAEVQGILSAVGATVTVLACDAEVHGVKDCANIRDAVALFKGGGGTSMTPIFTELEKRKVRPGVVVIITDGHIGNGYPRLEPSWCRTVWVVLGENGNPKPCPWGEVEVLTDAGAQEAA